MSAGPFCDLNQVMSLTEAMHAAAVDGRWDDLTGLAAEREPVLYAGTMRPAPETLESLKSIMLIDNLIKDLVSAARDESAVAWDASRRVRKAVAAYTSF
ncbi:flagellar protein FliT [Luteibacter aegosomaticola]|uniref:flagellar protein FliT n=1 Tax=Luteibacter aegosomaticola TaxID=2911538 RepID=UPI001FFA32ED|nr:flagellar protein FliT [Luteibacter aegosomaticola]UPG89017.1 flagellar protein FliT [Luteibacter aegosomaticola]